MTDLIQIFNQAIACHQTGKIPEAINLYLKILPMQRDNDELLLTIGTAYCQIGRLEDGLTYLKKSLAINPSNFHAHNNIGTLLTDLGRPDQAIQSFDRALTLNPNFPEALLGRGNAFMKAGRLEDAIQCYDKALVLVPNYAVAYLNKGKALQDLRKLEDALTAYGKAIALAPDFAEAYSNRGNVLKDLNRLEQALSDYDKAIQLNPNLEGVYTNRGCVLENLSRRDDAIADYEMAMLINPDIDYLRGNKLHNQAHLCNWNSFDTQIAAMMDKAKKRERVSAPFPLLALTDSPEMHKVASEVFVESKYPKAKTWPRFTRSTKASKIKIGYFSADFHDHATMHLMAELFEKHNKDRFELLAFSFGPVTHDAWQTRVKKVFDVFIECHEKSDTEIARLSRELGVDIAVDLKGFTQDSRTGIFAAGAAPIQVNFLGYPGTMGAGYIDYLIADESLIPERSRHFYTEKIAYLPDCYQPNCWSRVVSNESIARSDFGLPENGIVLSSFNNNYKITPDIFKSWIRILKEVEGSVLWLLASNPTAEASLRGQLESGGVDPARLIVAQRAPIEEHLNRMRLADLMLDTFPCGAHTTCSDALRVGVPVVTMKGKSFASRVAASLLTTVGLPELITDSQGSYESLVIALAKDPKRLTEIRLRLESNIKTSSLFNPELFARNLESLYTLMHQRRVNGFEPDHISIQ